jgi:exopolysaccharide biosynthesis polyprenyl glycosylphosphotransferase
MTTHPKERNAVTFNHAETDEPARTPEFDVPPQVPEFDAPAQVPEFDALEIRDRRLRILPNSQRASAPVENHWAHRRFAATRDISDHDDVEDLAAIQASLRREQVYRRALAVADGSSALAVTLIAAAIWGTTPSWLFVLIPLVAIIAGKVQGLYDRDDMVVRKSTIQEWRTVVRASALTTIGTYLIWCTQTMAPQGRGIKVFAFLAVGMFLLSLPARVLARRVARARTTDERCLIVGAPEQCRQLAKRLGDIRGVELIGTVSDDDVDCSVAGVYELIEQLNAERIIVVPHPGWGERGSLKLIQSSKWLGVRVSLMPTVMTVVGAATAVDELDTMVLLGVPRFGLSQSSSALKRTLDLGLGSLALLLASPLMAIVALIVRLDSHGPALFRQERVGRNGQSFTMYKFRSMVDGADHMKADLDHRNETAGLFKMTDDPRVTKVGKFIRRTYIDELPQLLNVMRGEMSLVGPRPLIKSEDALLTGYDRHRSRLMPGMTGPWQLRGPLDASLGELARLDYMYASNWSIWADIDILLGTAARVLNRHGR